MLSTDDFESAFGKSCEITDVTSEYESYGYVEEATLVHSAEGWEIEFFVLEDEAYAVEMFNTNKTTFENSKGNVSTSSNVSVGNYSSYSLTSSGSYMYICRVDNTLIYVRVDDEYKDAIKEVIKELGY